MNREEPERERRADTLVRRSSYLDVVGTHPEWPGAVPGPVALRAVRVGPGERRLFLFQELSANRKTPAETGAMVAEALTFADEPGGDPYRHDELIWADDTPDEKQVDGRVAARAGAACAAGEEE